MYSTTGFKTKQHTDLTVRCNGEEFYAHKVVLGAQSEFFALAFKHDSPFIEARTGVITLDDEDPILVRFMLSYCYTCEADVGILRDLPAGKKTGDNFYFGIYRKEESEKLMRWVLAYALADKYRVAGLKSAAQGAFHALLSNFYICGTLSPAFFTRLTHKIFETTPSTDLGLRRQAIAYASKHIVSLMSHQRFAESMKNLDGFWPELVRCNIETRKRERWCQVCKRDWNVSFENKLQQNEVQCRKCRNNFSIERWNPQAPPDKWYDEYDIKSSDGEEANIGTQPTKKRRVK
ncbi:hypothetical protein BC567DRAFT_209571 [Phyllosticta citribraziliensis]